MRRLLQLLCLLALAADAGAANPTPGQETLLPCPELQRDLPVFVPLDYAAEQRWPVVFFYHGTDGQPDVNLFRNYTGDHEFIVVGMTYRFRGQLAGSHREHLAHAKQELEIWRQTVARLAQQLAVDERRLIIAGLSKGGWMCSLLGELAPDEISGMIIIAAGRARRHRSAPNTMTRLPVYIGSGELDGANARARQAAISYRQFGAQVTFEEYPGLGHAASPDARLLHGWLQRQILRPVPATYEQLQAWFTAAFTEVRDTTTPLEAHRLGTILAADPRTGILPVKVRRGLKSYLGGLRQDPSVLAAYRAETTYMELLQAELEADRLSDYERIAAAFRELARTGADTRFGSRAMAQAERLAAMVTSAEASLEAARPAAAIQKTAPARTRATVNDGDQHKGIHIPFAH